MVERTTHCEGKITRAFLILIKSVRIKHKCLNQNEEVVNKVEFLSSYSDRKLRVVRSTEENLMCQLKKDQVVQG